MPERGLSTKLGGLRYWVEELIKRNELTYSSEAGMYVHKDIHALPRNNKLALAEIFLMALDYGYMANCKGVLVDIWNKLAYEANTKYIESVKEAILAPIVPPERKNTAQANLERLVWAMTGKKNELDIAALKQFMWCVKKNLAGRTHEISHIMMPVVYGGQDTGKTTIINGLLSPLEDLTIKSDFNVFKDERNLQAFNRMYVIFLDEMGKAKETSIESIKKIMSNGSLLQREFHSQDIFNKIRSRATFIAATNKHLSDIVIDDEMRRFWQIEMADYKHVNRHWDSIVKTMDWKSLWDCVDIEDREPADLVWHLFKKTQTIYASSDHVGKFVDERIDIHGTEWHDAIELYKAYQVWCEHHEFTKQLTRLRFYHKVKDLVLSKHSNGTKYCFTLKPFKEPAQETVIDEIMEEEYE